METNLIFIILFILCLVAFVIYAKLTAVKLNIQRDKNLLFFEFTKRTPVKKFIAILAEVDQRAIDSEIILMLRKYFELVLNKIEPTDVAPLLGDLNKSKNSDILVNALRSAAMKDVGFFGLALADVIGNENHTNKLVIEGFISGLSEEQKKLHYTVALNQLKQCLDTRWYDYPSAYQKSIKDAIRALEEKIK